MVTMTWPSATAKVLAIGRDRPANVDKRDQIAPAECVHSLAGVESVEARDDNVCFFQRSDRFRGWETLMTSLTTMSWSTSAAKRLAIRLLRVRSTSPALAPTWRPRLDSSSS